MDRDTIRATRFDVNYEPRVCLYTIELVDEQGD